MKNLSFSRKFPSRSEAGACRSARARLADHLGGDWSGRRARRRFRRHLRLCPDCREWVLAAERAWKDLGPLRPVSCPDYLVERVMERVEAARPLRRRLPRGLTLAAGAAAAGAALLAALRLISPAPVAPPPARDASVVAASPVAPPPVDRVLEEYLDEAEDFLSSLERTRDWRARLPFINRRDLTGRGNYLKERLPAGSRERAVVERVHDAFLELLRAGRAEAAAPPPLPLSELIGQIRELRATGRR